MNTPDPYRSPESEVAPPAAPRYDSRRQAAVAGMRRGAWLALKLIGGTLVVLCLAVLLAHAGFIAYFWFNKGIPLSSLLPSAKQLSGQVLAATGAIVYTTAIGMLICALVGGLTGALTYRQRNEASPDPVDGVGHRA